MRLRQDYLKESPGQYAHGECYRKHFFVPHKFTVIVSLISDLRHDGLDLHGAHILPLPPECVPDPVLEVHPAKLVLDQDVTRSGRSLITFERNFLL